jgi:predicted TIM-barrel enzyme
MFSVADAVIVASYLKEDGLWWNDVDTARLREFMTAANKARS